MSAVYGISFQGTSNVSGVIQTLTAELDTVKSKIREVNQETSGLGSFSTRGLQRGIFGLQMGVFYTGMLISAQTRAQLSALRLADAQEVYNKTLAEYGINSKQAVEAAKRLERAQLQAQQSNTLTTLSYVGMALQLVNVATTMKTVFLPTILKATMAIWGHVSALAAQAIAYAIAHPWMTAAMLAAGAAVAGALAAYSITVNVDGKGMTDSDLSAAFAEAERQTRYQYRRAPSP